MRLIAQFNTAVSILNRCTCDENKQYKTECIDHDVSLTAFDLLSHIIPVFFTFARRFDRLAIHDCRTWLWFAPFADTNRSSQCGLDEIPNTLPHPLKIIIIDMTVIREFSWQHFPLTSGFI